MADSVGAYSTRSAIDAFCARRAKVGGTHFAALAVGIGQAVAENALAIGAYFSRPAVLAFGAGRTHILNAGLSTVAVSRVPTISLDTILHQAKFSSPAIRVTGTGFTLRLFAKKTAWTICILTTCAWNAPAPLAEFA